MSMPQEGAEAPDFTLPSDRGTEVALRDLRGTPVVLYFYPKDDTPGCTTQACDFRDRWEDVRATGATVLGVSPDNERSHVKFRDKYKLPFPLLADAGGKVASAYGAWGEKSFMGRKYDGVHRSTFIIGSDGRIAKVFPKVKPEGHADEVLAVLRQL
jgi:peroxiredoxin Q/BCP